MTDIPEFEIYGQSHTTVRLLDGWRIDIDQEDPEAPHGTTGITIMGPVNVDILIAALQKFRAVMK